MPKGLSRAARQGLATLRARIGRGWDRIRGRSPVAELVWVDALIERGVAPDSAARIAPRLADERRELGRASVPGLLAGVVIASEVQREDCAAVERNLRDVREVERLLGAFSGELEKLDEVLEVLSAYAKRMRTPPASRPPRRLLH